MRADYRLFCWIVLAGSTCAGQEKDAGPVWKEAERTRDCARPSSGPSTS